MGKSLKQLNRIELLELMVGLSEDNERLAEENLRLNLALSAKPAISQTAKVGSIAEMALRANGYFDAVQRSADDYLREIKRMRDQLAARVENAARATAAPAAAQAPRQPQPQPHVQQPVQVQVTSTGEAQAQANAIIARARSQAESILADARAQAETMLTDASRQSRSTISRANHQADAIMQAARADAEQQAVRSAEQAQKARAEQGLAQAQPVRQTPAPTKAAKTQGTVADRAPAHGRHARV